MEYHGRWIRFSRQVPGYVQRYGDDRGMRQRNAKLLHDLGCCDNIRTRHELIYNNLPLAKYITWVWQPLTARLRVSQEDLYQDCCLALSDYIMRTSAQKLQSLEATNFQMTIYHTMSYPLHRKLYELDHRPPVQTQPYDEQNLPADNTQRINVEFLKWWIDTLPLWERNRNILKLYFFGDAQKHIQIYSIQDIAFFYGLTAERVRQILYSSIKACSRWTQQCLAEGRTIQYEDFYQD